MIKNGNPMFSSVNVNYDEVSENQATYKGVTIKTLFLLGISGITGIIAGTGLYRVNNFGALMSLLFISLIVGSFSIMIGRTSVKYSKFFAVLYAVCEGILLGTVTAIFDAAYQGIVLMAIIATLSVFLVCLLLFASGAMRNVSRLNSALMIIFFSYIFLMLISTICVVFNVPIIGNFISSNKGLSIGVSSVLIIYGAITLLLNFNEVTYYVQSGSSKEFEWIGSFGLLVSILYIYLQALYLLSYFLSRKD